VAADLAAAIDGAADEALSVIGVRSVRGDPVAAQLDRIEAKLATLAGIVEVLAETFDRHLPITTRAKLAVLRRRLHQ